MLDTVAAHGQFVHDHSSHIAMVVGPVLVLGMMALALHLTDPARKTQRAEHTHHTRHGIGPILWMTLMSAAIHFAVTPTHFQEALVIGVFFAVTTISQVAYAIRLWVRPTPQLLLLGAGGNLLLATIWCYSRLVAIPFGLGPKEAVGFWDVASTLLELGCVAIAFAITAPRAAAATSWQHSVHA